MLARLHREDLRPLAGMFLLGVASMLAAVLISNAIAKKQLREDAKLLATHWATHVAGHLAAPDELKLAPDHDHRMESPDGKQLLQAPGRDVHEHAAEASNPAEPGTHDENGAHGHAETAAPGRSSPAGTDARTFHSGIHVSYVHRYAVFSHAGELIAKGPNFSGADLDAMTRDPGFRAALDETVGSGRLFARDMDLAAADQPAHIARVFVPVSRDDAPLRVFVVDIDQAAAVTLISTALKIVALLTGLLMALGIGVASFVIWRHIRDRLGMREKIQFLAMHDALTNLPNRTEYIRSVREALEAAERDNETVAVLALDVDRFRQINESLGHPAGDTLLERISEMIRAVVAGYDATAARVGGDEFGIAVRGPDARLHALALASELRDRIATPFVTEGQEVTSSVSVGMAVGPADGEDAQTLLKHADMALFHAKCSGLNSTRFYVPAMERIAKERREMEQDLRRALEREELYLLYQPQVDLITGAVIGYEALLRWDHPEKGPVSPDEFIPSAEETGMILGMGEWALRTACRYAATWPEPLKIAVNLSATQFMTGDIVATVTAILDETGLDPTRLELEITESLLLHNIERVQTALRKLDALGVSLALDDFGTGYSSLSYLARFPFKKIKIDQSFVAALDNSPEATAVVRTIVGLGRALAVDTIAEGVETTDQMQILRAAGCTKVQGFLYGTPQRNILDAWSATVKMARMMREEFLAAEPSEQPDRLSARQQSA